MAKTKKAESAVETVEELDQVNQAAETSTDDNVNPLTSMSNDELLDAAKAQLVKSKLFFEEIQQTRYPIDITSKAMSFIKKYLEKDAPWDAKTSGGLLALYSDLKNVSVNQEVVELKHSSVSNLYNFLLGFKGNGYFEAREYIKILTVIGDSIQKAMESIDKRNKEYQDIHRVLSEYDDELQLRNLKIDDEEINQLVNQKTETQTTDDESVTQGPESAE